MIRRWIHTWWWMMLAISGLMDAVSVHSKDLTPIPSVFRSRPANLIAAAAPSMLRSFMAVLKAWSAMNFCIQHISLSNFPAPCLAALSPSLCVFRDIKIVWRRMNPTEDTERWGHVRLDQIRPRTRTEKGYKGAHKEKTASTIWNGLFFLSKAFTLSTIWEFRRTRRKKERGVQKIFISLPPSPFYQYIYIEREHVPACETIPGGALFAPGDVAQGHGRSN